MAYGTSAGMIRSNVVSFTGAPVGGTYGYNVHNSTGVIFEDNKCFDASRGFNQDTGRQPEHGEQQSCVRLRRNLFHVPAGSVGAFIWDAKESIFESNTIFLEGEGAVGLIMEGPSELFQTRGAHRWIVQNNNIYKSPSVKSCQGFNFNYRFYDPPSRKLIQSLPTEIVLRHNFLHNGIVNVVPERAVAYSIGNYIFYSNRVPPGIPQPHGSQPAWVVSLDCPR
jgi:hypothetical protein